MIGYGKQSVDEMDIAAVVDVLGGSHLTCGMTIDNFEDALCSLSGAKNAVAVSNGTSALRLLYQVAGIGPGKRVGVPAIT
ncbi:MAG: DegT/DnrJ/EryC1/StrS family aminotransferase, partial [Planctomycetes bacterium]|nr:DegT/DnrJ/EryC1/StrS family aminotransferase [Planctomycetota bacterium]